MATIALCALLTAWPAGVFASAPGPPNVEVVPPAVIVDERGEVGVVFDPGLIQFTYADGSATSCVLDPAAPPNPCNELASNPGPPDVEIVPPEAIRGEDGGLVGFVAGSLLITFGDGSQLSCVLDPAVPPNPCAEVGRG
jgi:hypothetical protein